MSKTNKTTKVATFRGWGIQDGEFCELHPIPSSGMGMAVTSAGDVGWVNTFISPSVGDKVLLRKNAPVSGKPTNSCNWVMTGYA